MTVKMSKKLRNQLNQPLTIREWHRVMASDTQHGYLYPACGHPRHAGDRIFRLDWGWICEPCTGIDWVEPA